MELRQNMSSLLGLLMFILIIVGATAAYIAYKNPNTSDLVFWSIFGVIIVFLLSVFFFGGVKLPAPRTVTQYIKFVIKDMFLRTIVLSTI